MIVVPTSSTFIEAEPGTRLVREGYKLVHRSSMWLRPLLTSVPDIQTMVVAPADAGVTVGTPPGGGNG